MTRKKVKLAFIANDSARKATFKKRKKGLMKKVHELSTLCGIDACAIIYSPYESQPEVWPNNIGVQRVLAQFKRMPLMEQSKKMVNQESFIRQRITKTSEQLKKQIKENLEKEMNEVMYRCLTGKGSIENLILTDLNDMGRLVDRTIKDICGRIESLKKCVVEPPAPRQQATVTTNEMITRGGVMHETAQWFTDWINNSSEHNPGLGLVYEMAPFVDNPNPIWSNAFFP
ncbi:agamous-like MADS-box protein AGL80 [Rutidosis leptorrhynchoides]|uniref:agamous-like MADS-box protein AGL80 n=1 Tax=Rutidosis leptorrhynchoides TaxID=125765 RepID=UPI003A9A2565